MKITKFFICLVLSLLFTNAFADEPTIQIVGTEPATIISTQPVYIFKEITAVDTHKPISLQRVALSTNARQHIMNQLQKLNRDLINHYMHPSSAKINLGMSNVPVLDQGVHGTCVTFATTAAINAAYNKGDYISQLCNLSLGSYLRLISQGKHPSGWDGSFSETVLQQIQTYGILSKSYQETLGCAGVKVYPKDNPHDKGNLLSVDEFSLHSEKFSSMKVLSHLNVNDAFTPRANTQNVIKKVKEALNNQHRIVVSFLLDDNDGSVGTYGTYQANRDTWIVMPHILKHLRMNQIKAGHTAIIVGYDDSAVVHHDGKNHKGLFIIRNSWGESNGDKGNYYMSYEYFRTLAAEAIEIVPH